MKKLLIIGLIGLIGHIANAQNVTKTLTLDGNGTVTKPANFWVTNNASIKSAIGVSGNNTGDQTIVLSGAVTGNGTGNITTALTANAARDNLTGGNGTLNLGNYTLTLPAGTGANMTGMNATQITTGTLAAARLPNITLNMSGVLYTSPVTLTNGTGTVSLATQSANTVLAGPTSGNATAPTFRALVNGDLPVNPTITGNLTINGNLNAGDAAGDNHTIRGNMRGQDQAADYSDSYMTRLPASIEPMQYYTRRASAAEYTYSSSNGTAAASGGLARVEVSGGGVAGNFGKATTTFQGIYGFPTSGNYHIAFELDMASILAGEVKVLWAFHSDPSSGTLAGKGFGLEIFPATSNNLVISVHNGTTLYTSTVTWNPAGGTGWSSSSTHLLLAWNGATSTLNVYGASPQISVNRAVLLGSCTASTPLSGSFSGSPAVYFYMWGTTARTYSQWAGMRELVFTQR